MSAARTRSWVGKVLLVAVAVSALMVMCVPAPAVASDSGRTSALLVRGAGLDRAQGSAPVRALQRRLRAVGVDPGPVDGRFGALTEAAVRQVPVCPWAGGRRDRRPPHPSRPARAGAARARRGHRPGWRVGSGPRAAAPAARCGRRSGPGRRALRRSDRGRGATLPARARARGRRHRRPPHHTAAGTPRQAGSGAAAAAGRNAERGDTRSGRARSDRRSPRPPRSVGVRPPAAPTRSGSRCWSRSP